MTNLLIGEDPTIQFPRTTGPSATPYDAYIATLSPLVNLKFDEASGAIINYGSLGGSAAVTGSVTYEVAGSPTGSAVRVDGAAEYFTVTNNAALDMTAFSKIYTVRGHSAGVGNNFGRIFQHNDEVIYFQADVRVTYEVFIGGAKVTASQTANQLGGSNPTGWFTAVVTVTGATAALYVFNATINTSAASTGTGTADSHGANNLSIGNRLSDTARNANADFGGAVITASVLDASDVADLRLILYGV